MSIKLAKAFRSVQLIENVPWTDDDYFDVAQSVAKKIVFEEKKKLRVRDLECRFYEMGIVEFRIR